MREPVPNPWHFASPAYHPTWRDSLAFRLANGVMNLLATQQYRAGMAHMYNRGWRCAIKHEADCA